MPPLHEKLKMLLSEYQAVKEMLLQALSDYEDGISFERLMKKVSELWPFGESPRLSELRTHVKRALIELGAEGLIERVPDADPAEFRLPVKGREAFMDAARRGHIAVLNRLLVEGLGQATKDAALISAVINNHPEVVRLLLEAGAHVHAKDSLFGKDALMYVTGRTSERIVDLLKTASNNAIQPITN